MTQESEKDRLLQRRWREEVIPNIGKQPWIRVYQRGEVSKPLQVDIGSIFVPNANVSNLLDSAGWGGDVDSTGPEYYYTRDEANDPNYRYSRFGNDLGIEPLVLRRRYFGFRPPTIEILEEFRLFHDLYFDSAKDTYVRHDESGDEIEVVRVDKDKVDVKRWELRQFLTARRMSLAVHIDRKYFSSLSIDMLNEQERLWESRDEKLVCEFGAIRWDDSLETSRKSYSWLLAKKIVKGLRAQESGLWPFDEAAKKEYEKFIIGVDDNDNPLYYTSNPDQLADYFGKNKHAPNFLTPVFFTRDVLHKYYNESSKYKIADGGLWCGDRWSLPLDNNHEHFVIVFLGDLGGNLPRKEQLHWKQYNVPPDGRMSDTNIRRSFYAEFAEPEDSAILFKQTYETFSEAWLKQFSFYLFKPLSEADTQHFQKLRRPVTRELAEFHEIVLSLSILLQDRLDKKELGKLIPGFKKTDADKKAKRNIFVLNEFLECFDFPEAVHYVEYLRMLQILRSNSGTVHPRNEKEYQKAVAFFSLDTKSTVQVADDIFTTLTNFLDSLREHFCLDAND